MIEFDLSKINFQIIRDSETGSARLVDIDTGKQFGEHVQVLQRTPEYKSSMIVYQKYKKEYKLTIEDLKNIQNFCIGFKKERESSGKKCSDDFLTQKASEFVKLNYKNEKLDN